MMNRFQVCVTSAYAEGAYAPLANSETWRKDIDELGDGLFRYLILELSTEENCETWTEAIKRVEHAIHELEQVSAALRAAYLQGEAERANDDAPAPGPRALTPTTRPHIRQQPQSIPTLNVTFEIANVECLGTLGPGLFCCLNSRADGLLCPRCTVSTRPSSLPTA